MMTNSTMTQAQKFRNPIEKGDALARLGYTLRRTDTLGLYMLTKPDGTRYRVDAANGRCSCPATIDYCCHQAFCHWFHSYDRALADLASAHPLLLDECRVSMDAAAWCLERVAGVGAVAVEARRAA